MSIPRILPCSARNVLPRSAKSASRAGKESFLLVFLGVLVGLEIVKFGDAEEGGDEDDEEDGYFGGLNVSVESC